MADAPDVLVLDQVGLTVGPRVLLAEGTLRVAAGEGVAIVGASGAGKTTLLSAIGGLTAHTGCVEVAGTVVTRRTARRLRRHEIGMVFQHGELLDELSPVENVALAASIAAGSTAGVGDHAAELLAELGVPIDVDDCWTLSGGERQRVALARALVNQPSVVLADEPTGALDEATRDATLTVLQERVARAGAALVVVTHDPVVAGRMSRRVELSEARLVERS